MAVAVLGDDAFVTELAHGGKERAAVLERLAGCPRRAIQSEIDEFMPPLFVRLPVKSLSWQRRRSKMT